MTDLEQMIAGVRARRTRDLARAITLVESRREADRERIRALLEALGPGAGEGSRRIGVTGPPGVGKSTLIEALGLEALRSRGSLAVLAVDPTSSRTGGSLLGDKTRMARLVRRPEVFVRPSPSGESVGGIAASTREAIVLCEAAGHEVVLVETVGVGQSERALEGLVDTFLVLVSSDGGDELQGAKRGVLELADVVAVTKADGDGRVRAERMKGDLEPALGVLAPREPGWRTPVLAVSAREGTGVAELWAALEEHRSVLEASGRLLARRADQDAAWFARLVGEGVRSRIESDPGLSARRRELEAAVREGRATPLAASEEFLAHVAARWSD